MGEEPISNFPIRQDITVLPEDHPNTWKIGLFAYTRLGCPIWDEDGNTIKRLEDLTVGKIVKVAGLYGNYLTPISEVNGKSAKAEGLYAMIGWDEETSEWVNFGYCNDNAVKTVDFT